MISLNSADLTRGRIIKTAFDWLDTPYQHQASLKGAGCDCLGLIRGVWRELYGDEPAAPPPYTVDWAERAQTETFLEAAQTYLKSFMPIGAAPWLRAISFLIGGGAGPIVLLFQQWINKCQH